MFEVGWLIHGGVVLEALGTNTPFLVLGISAMIMLKIYETLGLTQVSIPFKISSFRVACSCFIGSQQQSHFRQPYPPVITNAILNLVVTGCSARDGYLSWIITRHKLETTSRERAELVRGLLCWLSLIGECARISIAHLGEMARHRTSLLCSSAISSLVGSFS